MIGQSIKKEWLRFRRAPQELVILLVMPIILTSILGFAFGGFSVDDEVVTAEVGWVDHDTAALNPEVLASLTGSPEEQQGWEQAFSEMDPVRILKEEVLSGSSSVAVTEMTAVAAGDDLTAIIEVPDGFREAFARHLLAGEEAPSVTVHLNEDRSVTGGMIEQIVTGFEQQYSRTLEMNALGVTAGTEPPAVTVEPLAGKASLSMSTYYAIGMSVMFALYVSSNMSRGAIEEKRWNVFDRLVVSGISGVSYVGAIFITTTMLTMLQLSILFTVSYFLFNVVWPSISLLVLVIGMLSFANGGIAVLLTSVVFKGAKEGLLNVYANFIVTVLAFVGGSFFPVNVLPDVMQTISRLTPNGAAQSAMLKVQLEQGAGAITTELLVLVVYGVLFLLISIYLFPKRGRAA